jgi:hypothetical protein
VRVAAWNDVIAIQLGGELNQTVYAVHDPSVSWRIDATLATYAT